MAVTFSCIDMGRWGLARAGRLRALICESCWPASYTTIHAPNQSFSLGHVASLFLKHWMKKQRHQALQRGSSFSVNSRSEEEAFSILVSSHTSCFFPTLPLSQSQCKKISGQRKSVGSLLLHQCHFVDKRGRAPSCWPTAPCRRSPPAPPPSNTLPHAPSFHPCPLIALRLPIVRPPPTRSSPTTRSPPAPPPTVQLLLLAIREAPDEAARATRTQVHVSGVAVPADNHIPCLDVAVHQ